MNVLACSNALHESDFVAHVELQHQKKQRGRCRHLEGMELGGMYQSWGSLWSLQPDHVGVSLLLLCCRQRRTKSSRAHGSRCSTLRLLSLLLNACMALRAV